MVRCSQCGGRLDQDRNQLYEQMYEKSKETNKLIASKVGRLEQEVKDIRKKYEKAKEKLQNKNSTRNHNTAMSGELVKDEIINELKRSLHEAGRSSTADILEGLLSKVYSIPVMSSEPSSDFHDIKTILSEHRQRVLIAETAASKHKRALKRAIRDKSRVDAELSSQQSHSQQTIIKYKDYLKRYKTQLASAREEINNLRAQQPDPDCSISDWQHMERELTTEWRSCPHDDVGNEKNNNSKYVSNSLFSNKNHVVNRILKHSDPTPRVRSVSRPHQQTHPHDRRFQPTCQSESPENSNRPSLNDDLIQLEKDLADLQHSLLN